MSIISSKALFRSVMVGVASTLLLLLLCANTQHQRHQIQVVEAWYPTPSLDKPRAFGCSAFWMFYIQLIGGVKYHFESYSDDNLFSNIDSFDLTQNYRWQDNFFQTFPVGVAGSSSCASIGGDLTVVHLGCQPQINASATASSTLMLVAGPGQTTTLQPKNLIKRVRASLLQNDQVVYIIGGQDKNGTSLYLIEKFAKKDLQLAVKALDQHFLFESDHDNNNNNTNPPRVASSSSFSTTTKRLVEQENVLAPVAHCNIDVPACDCHAAPVGEIAVLVCADCSRDPPGSTKIPPRNLYTTWMLLNLTSCETKPLPEFGALSPELTNRTFAEVVSVSVATVAQYAVMVLYFYDSVVPAVAYWDFYLYQWHFNYNASGAPRVFGVGATISSNFLYAGGVTIGNFTTDNTTGEPEMHLTGVSDIVESQPVVKSVTMAVNNVTRIFNPGDIVSIDCVPDYTIRLAISARCTSKGPGTIDTVCPASGIANILVPNQGGSYYLCASLGSCVGPKEDRIACPTGNWPNFHTCNVLGGCCYCDISKMCFGYRTHYLPNINESNNPNLFFYLNLANPITVQSVPVPYGPSPTPSSPPANNTNNNDNNGNSILHFLTTGPGITAALLVAMVFLVAAVWIGGRVWRRATRSGKKRYGTDGRLLGSDEESEGDDNDDDAEDASQAQILQTYRPVKKLGKGGFGYVFLVEKKTTKELFALKYIPCPEEKDRTAALREFDAIRAIPPHPNLIQIHDIRMNWAVEPTNYGSASGQNLSGSIAAPRSESELSTNSNRNGNVNQNSNENEESSGSGGSGDSKNNNTKSGNNVSTGKNGDGGSSPTTPRGKSSSNLQDTLLGLAHRSRYVCIVMDYFPEGDLARYIFEITMVQRQIFPEEWIVGVIGRQLCSVLSVMHSQTPPIVHRDMKPENVLLDDTANRVVIVDFGLARQHDKTYMTTRAGSLQYIAPECWKRHYSAAVDMWAVGCIMYAAATGRVTAETARVMFNDVNDRHFKKEITSELEEQCGYSKEFTGLVLSLLEADPSKRLSAQECLVNIDAVPRWRLRGKINLPKPGSHLRD